MSEALVIRESWGGAAERGLQARDERTAIIKRVLVADVDFGVIPGTKQATLLKPGAEKIVDCLNLYPDYERITSTEDWDRPLFHYNYRCVLKVRGSDGVVATGIGSCNSMEARYRWRNTNRVCPKCGQETIIKGKEEYGGGWLCFAKKGGCGAKYEGDAVVITSQKVGQVANDDVFSLVNTIDKMAQKRALVAASLNLGFSDHFTQDIEDNPTVFGGKIQEESGPNPVATPKAAPRPQPAPGPVGAPVWVGKIVNMEPRSGKKDGKDWSSFTFTGADGRKFITFSDTIASGILKLEGGFVEIVFSDTGRGTPRIEEYSDATGKEVPL